MSDIHISVDANPRPWPDVWTPLDLVCPQGGDHLAPLDVLLPGGLLVRVLHPFVATDAAGAYELLRYTSAHATEMGIGRGLAPFARLEDPAPVRPARRQDVIEGLARALDAAIGLEARRTRFLLQAFLKTYGDFLIDEDDGPLHLRLPRQGRATLRLLQGPAASDILAKRLPFPLLARTARLRAPDGQGGLAYPEILPWIPFSSAHAALATQQDLERLLAGGACRAPGQ